ncbi:MAG: hypothetical protein F7C36_08155 [Desulfurococcales archaeon]|nr:hypothetical protein [Desulfurococcales archaeon]
MVLHHRTSKTVKSLREKCLECIADPTGLLSTSKYTKEVKKLGEDLYLVVFEWKKFGMKKRFEVVFKVVKGKDTVEYKSVEGTKYPFDMKFLLKPKDKDLLEITIDAWMKAGLMADLFGKKDYAEFIEELVDTGLVNLLSRMSAGYVKSGEIANCANCLLYDPVKKYCYYMRKQVEDPDKPVCDGKGFISEKAVI